MFSKLSTKLTEKWFFSFKLKSSIYENLVFILKQNTLYNFSALTILNYIINYLCIYKLTWHNTTAPILHSGAPKTFKVIAAMPIDIGSLRKHSRLVLSWQAGSGWILWSAHNVNNKLQRIANVNYVLFSLLSVRTPRNRYSLTNIIILLCIARPQNHTNITYTHRYIISTQNALLIYHTCIVPLSQSEVL